MPLLDMANGAKHALAQVFIVIKAPRDWPQTDRDSGGGLADKVALIALAVGMDRFRLRS
jgi:hypothetical protein